MKNMKIHQHKTNVKNSVFKVTDQDKIKRAWDTNILAFLTTIFFLKKIIIKKKKKIQGEIWEMNRKFVMERRNGHCWLIPV